MDKNAHETIVAPPSIAVIWCNGDVNLRVIGSATDALSDGKKKGTRSFLKPEGTAKVDCCNAMDAKVFHAFVCFIIAIIIGK